MGTSPERGERAEGSGRRERTWVDPDGARWRVWTAGDELFFESGEGLFAVKIREDVPVTRLTDGELASLLERARG